jgi:hypothetical protein
MPVPSRVQAQRPASRGGVVIGAPRSREASPDSALVVPGGDAWIPAGIDIEDGPNDPLEEADLLRWSLPDLVRRHCHNPARLTSDLVSEGAFAEFAGTRRLPLPLGHG